MHVFPFLPHLLNSQTALEAEVWPSFREAMWDSLIP